MAAAPKPDRDRVLVAENRKARFQYEIAEDLEVGMVLTGTEVKSLRDGKLQLADAYAVIDGGEVFLHQVHIGHYAQGNVFNHEPMRRRKLLLHRREIERLARRVDEKGYTLIPLEVYFLRGRAKLKLGVCRGKKQYDKRQAIKARDLDRDQDHG